MERIKKVIIDGLTYIKEYQENSIILTSTKKNKYGYYITMEIPNRTDENDKFKEIIEDYFLREIL